MRLSVRCVVLQLAVCSIYGDCLHVVLYDVDCAMLCCTMIACIHLLYFGCLYIVLYGECMFGCIIINCF